MSEFTLKLERKINMKFEKAYAVYFSTSDNSKKTAVAVAGGIAAAVEKIDITDNAVMPSKTEFAADEIAVFCAPVFSGRIPAVAMKKFFAIKGNGTPAVVLVNYGNREYDDALLEMLDNLTLNGFVPVAAGGFIGQHTFGEIASGRPNAQDLAEAEEFGKKVAEKLAGVATACEAGEVKVKGNRPYKAYGKAAFQPLADKELCINCGACAVKCPAAAISLEDPSSAPDPEKCISCFKCIKVCPTAARKMDTPQYGEFFKMITARLAQPAKSNEMII